METKPILMIMSQRMLSPLMMFKLKKTLEFKLYMYKLMETMNVVNKKIETIIGSLILKHMCLAKQKLFLKMEQRTVFSLTLL